MAGPVRDGCGGGAADGTYRQVGEKRGAPMLYQNGDCRVDVAEDGSIHVKKGDWLSKYSYAMYGDFEHIAEFGRADKLGTIRRVANVNVIFDGELLFHIPSHDNYIGRRNKKTNITPVPPVTSDQQNEAALNAITDPDLRDMLENIYSALEGVGKAGEFLEMFELFGHVGEIGGRIGVVTSVVGPILDVILLELTSRRKKEWQS